MTEEESLVKRCLEKDVSAEYRLYKKLAPSLYGVCLRYGGNEAEAQEILQKGFIKIFRGLHQFRWEGELAGWAKRIMIRTAIDHYEQEMRHGKEVRRMDESEVFAVEDDVSPYLSAQDLLGLVQRLPPGYRAVFNLFAIENLTHKEIAAILGISESTSKTQYFRARMALQRMMREPSDNQIVE